MKFDHKCNLNISHFINFTDGITNCEYVDQNGCFIYFTYFYDDDGTLRVEVQKEPGGFHIPPSLFIVGLFQLKNAYLCRLVIKTHTCTFCDSISFQK